MFLNFFDEVYVINLPHRLDRRQEMNEELGRHGIPFTIFEATLDDNGIKGLVETMKRFFRHALSKKQSNVMVLEDDAHFMVNNPVQFLAEVLPQLPKDYQLFYLGLNLLERPIRMSDNILKVRDAYSTHAICYSAEGMRACLEMLEVVPLMPYDIFMRQEIIPRNAAYCTFPMMATQRESYSDIEKRFPEWGKLMLQTFNIHTKNLQQQPMATEIVHCVYGHQFNGNMPVVDETLFQIQKPELVGKTCDCGRFVYDEGLCPTCSGDKWKVIWREK